MIHVYKYGGDWTINGAKFDVKCINQSKLSLYLEDGYTLEPIKPTKVKTTTKKAVTNGSDDGADTE